MSRGTGHCRPMRPELQPAGVSDPGRRHVAAGGDAQGRVADGTERGLDLIEMSNAPDLFFRHIPDDVGPGVFTCKGAECRRYVESVN